MTIPPLIERRRRTRVYDTKRDNAGEVFTSIGDELAAAEARLAALETMPYAGFKGATAAGPTDNLTPDQAAAILPVFTATTKGEAPASGGGALNFLRADGTWAAILNTVLTGFTPALTRTAIIATDTILSAFEKVQKYLNDLKPLAFSALWSDLTATPTTLAGYGITDAQPLDADLTSLAAAAGTNTIYYRSAPDTWSPVTIGANITFSGGTLAAAGGGGITALTGDVTASGTGSVAATIAAGAVTLSKMANLTASTILGNNTGLAATPIALTGAQVTAMLGLSTGSLKGLAPSSPSDATQFLNGAATPAYAAVKDSDLSTSDITTNNVSTSKHGFAPKAPNDVSKFLDGTGAWSSPGVQTRFTFRTCASTSQNTGAHATKANQMKAAAAGSFTHLQVYQNAGGGDTYKAFVAVVNGSHVIQSITLSPSVSGVNGGLVLFTFSSPVAFNAGDVLAIGIVVTNGTTTRICNAFTLTSGTFDGLGLENKANYYTLDSILPTVGDTFTATSGTTMSIQPVYTLAI